MPATGGRRSRCRPARASWPRVTRPPNLGDDAGSHALALAAACRAAGACHLAADDCCRATRAPPRATADPGTWIVGARRGRAAARIARRYGARPVGSVGRARRRAPAARARSRRRCAGAACSSFAEPNLLSRPRATGTDPLTARTRWRGDGRRARPRAAPGDRLQPAARADRLEARHQPPRVRGGRITTVGGAAGRGRARHGDGRGRRRAHERPRDRGRLARDVRDELRDRPLVREHRPPDQGGRRGRLPRAEHELRLRPRSASPSPPSSSARPAPASCSSPRPATSSPRGTRSSTRRRCRTS